LAFSPGKITVEDVHNMLGTAGDSLLMGLIGHVVNREAAAALKDLDAAVMAGVDAPQLIEQLFGYFRDCMAASVGCQPDAFLYASPSNADEISAAGKKLGLQTVLAVMQILDQTLSRMRYSTQGRILAELALVRICHLEDLEELSQVIAQICGGMPIAVQSSPMPAVSAASYPSLPSPAASQASLADEGLKKNAEPAVSYSESVSEPSAQIVARQALTPDNAMEIWSRAVALVSGMVADQARQFHAVAIFAPNALAIRFKSEYASAKSMCERQSRRFEDALAEVTGQRIRLDFQVEESGGPAVVTSNQPARPVSQHQLMMEVVKQPMVQRAAELFGATPMKVEPPSRE
jgi:DNA polymerase-3 subunit gamma/tau